ncbi:MULTISPECIES: hypothetical protein [unclassified Arthrobacter]|uniref:hypothetical protein n=1 Tax=unclassified Arthrobacter TaxID=235627 RepID=UPI002E0AC9E4|nr:MULTISPECIES: hypothetical protein [unclassified Arthrobacter]MEC5190766.1 hypothetical protein [Arthrobacter sp. MP_M4]MEC5202850.1 hypothetical protein [Arthrobacter sp. MP_M7]
MESLLIPLLILVLVGAGVLLGARALNRSRQSRPEASPAPVRDPIELARASAAKLDQEQHRRLYALIAQGQAMGAIKLYLEATGDGLRASRDAVGALAAHPQPFRPEAAEQTPSEEDDDAPQRFAYRYRAIASKGEITREVSSNMLNDEIYGRIRTMARSGDTEAAAEALTRHSDISIKQAREFIALLED